jgi:WD40 repeat protein
VARATYRTLPAGPVYRGASNYTGCAISPNGRVLVLTLHTGISFWDLSRRKELAFVHNPRTASVVFESSDALLTGGPPGLLRWPVQEDDGAPGLLRIGPPTRLLPFWGDGIACSSDGRIITSPQGSGCLVLDRDHPDQPIPLTPHKDARFTAVSPDGRWAATGSHQDTKVKIWEARTGKFVKELPVETGSMVSFSPDGKWLATSGGGLTLWTVGSWNPGKRIGGEYFAFSPDSNVLAVETGHGIRLVDVENGREYARLEDPNQEPAIRICFSPDGAQLVAQARQSVHVWDLRALRAQLAELGLDWDLPQYPPDGSHDDQPLQVQVDTGALGAMLQAQDSRLQAADFLRSKQWDKAIGVYAQAIELDPKNATILNDLAWLLATCPDARVRDPGRALELAARTAKLTPQEGNAWNTLGVAHYRAGQWKAAIEALEKSNELLGGKELSFNAFFLAMAHRQLGDKSQAQAWYDKAVKWMEEKQPTNEELARFRTEAATLLEMNRKKQ